MALWRLKLGDWDVHEKAEVEERQPSAGFLRTVYAKVLRPNHEPELEEPTESTLLESLYTPRGSSSSGHAGMPTTPKTQPPATPLAEGMATPASAPSPLAKAAMTPPTTPKTQSPATPLAKGLATPAASPPAKAAMTPPTTPETQPPASPLAKGLATPASAAPLAKAAVTPPTTLDAQPPTTAGPAPAGAAPSVAGAATPAPKKHGLSPDSSDKNLDPSAKRHKGPALSVENLIDSANNLWVRY